MILNCQQGSQSLADFTNNSPSIGEVRMSWLMSSNLVFAAGNHKTETWKSSISVNEISGKLHNDQPYRPYRVEISINFFSSVAPVEESELIKGFYLKKKWFSGQRISDTWECQMFGQIVMKHLGVEVLSAVLLVRSGCTCFITVSSRSVHQKQMSW